MNPTITIRNARLHNLKNVTLEIPKNKLVVITGLSGSGKSTLAFDILNKEGQRQYLESLGLVTWGVTKPPVELHHRPLPLHQRGPAPDEPQSALDRGNGHRSFHLPENPIRPPWSSSLPCLRKGCSAAQLTNWMKRIWKMSPTKAPEALIPVHTVARRCLKWAWQISRSTNRPAPAPPAPGWAWCGRSSSAKWWMKTKASLRYAVEGWIEFHVNYYSSDPAGCGQTFGFEFDLSKAVKDYTPVQRDLFLYGTDSPQMRRHFPSIKPPTMVKQGKFEGVITNLQRRYDEHATNAAYLEKLDHLFTSQACPDCEGTRLRPESRAVTVAGELIVKVSKWSLNDLDSWLRTLPSHFTPDEMLLARPILDDLFERAGRLLEVGVGYLSLERSSPTLSAGEAQRLRLAALLGSGLTGVLYVLDEPTIGLHARDNHRLIKVMRRLRDLGNTVLVVEHDLELIQSADHLIDVGPGAGKHGGQIVAAGTPEEVSRVKESLTGAFLAGTMCVPVPEHRRVPNHKNLTITGARQFNLQNVTVRIPLGLLVAVTGVSGSGKSSLIFDILDVAARQRLNGSSEIPGEHDSITGWEHIDKVITIDQAHIGRLPRSNAATYSDTFTPIREAFAATPEAKRNRITARHFSFNVPGGRCERCEGAGTLTVKMHFLPEVEVRCPVCHGRRFKKETLAIKYRGFDISQVLEMTVEEALGLFEEVPAAASRLKVMSEVGLGYLQLGQPATTLSGGEAQRVKLAKELGRRSTGRTLYLLDEPTTGLHAADTARLLLVLQRLVDAGNSVIFVEHNLDLVKAADWVIDLGPEGGAGGGQLVAEGTPEDVAKVTDSYTGQCLKSRL